MNEYDETMLRRWLMHQLPADQAQPLEQRLLQDDELGTSLRAAETDLLDDFACGRLDATDRAAVAKHVLSSAHDRYRVQFAAALARHAEPPATTVSTPDDTRRHFWVSIRKPSTRRRVAIWSGLTAACAVLAIAVGLNVSNRGRSGIAEQSAMTIALAEPERGATATEIRIPQGIGIIRLQAEVEAGAPDTRYTLTVADRNHTVFIATNLLPKDAPPYHYVNVDIATRSLGQGERVVRVAPQEAGAPTTVWRLHIAAIAEPSQNTK